MKPLPKAMRLLFVFCMLIVLMPAAAKAAKHTYTVSNAKNGSDITKKLQYYLDYAAEGEAGDTYEIIVPAGTYHLSASLALYSNTTLISNGVTYIRDNGKKTMLRAGRPSEQVPLYRYNGYHDIAIIGGTWDGNKGTVPIYRNAHEKNITIKDCTFCRTKSTHMVTFGACKNVLIDNCTFKDFIGKSTARTEALQFDIMKEAVFPNQPAYDDTPCADITVQNCTFTGVPSGVGTHSSIAGSYFNNFKFLNNTFTDLFSYAIITSNFTNCEISGNKITDCGSGIIIRTYAKEVKSFYPSLSRNVTVVKKQNVKVSGNTISVKYRGYKSMATAIKVYGQKTKKKNKLGAPAADYRAGKIEISGNTITFPVKGIAVALEGAVSCKVNSNNITVNVQNKATNAGPGDGIRLTKCQKCTVSGNTIVSKANNKLCETQSGINLLKSKKTKISKNPIKGFASDGVRVNDSSTATVTRNKIKSCKRFGILAWKKSKATISKNTIKKSGKKATRTMEGGKINGKTIGPND